ncbi:MAG: hypothetical protein U0744_09870 [Gemmataceae bacterium]
MPDAPNLRRLLGSSDREAPTESPAPRGQSTRAITRADTPACNFHITFIRDSSGIITSIAREVYYILEGCGKMQLGDDVIDIPSQV